VWICVRSVLNSLSTNIHPAGCAARSSTPLIIIIKYKYKRKEMISTPRCESDSSFRDDDFLEGDTNEARRIESEEEGSSYTDQWGVVSVSADGTPIVDQEGQESRNSDFFNSGVLILDGANSSSMDELTENGYFDLSIPGTDSLPTDIGTLGDNGYSLGDEESVDHCAHAHSRKRLAMLLLLLLPVVGAVVGLGFLFQERNSWRTSALRLEQEIERLEMESQKRLEQEIERLATLDWEETTDNSVTLLDNCWLKAKADFQLGMCGGEAVERVKDLSDSIRGTFDSWWDASSKLNTAKLMGAAGIMGLAFQATGSAFHEEELHCDGSSYSETQDQAKYGFGEQAASVVAVVPLAWGEAVSALSERMTEFLGDGKVRIRRKRNKNLTVDGVEEVASALTQASLELSDAISAASDAAFAYEIDPWTFLKGAARGVLKDASCTGTAKPEQVTILSAASAVSSASLAVGDAVTNAAGAVAVRVTELMGDPLSYFEYETSDKRSD
jgi:hypothetical protein